MTTKYLPQPEAQASAADQVRRMGLAVGDTIEGRDEYPGGWCATRLTLLWVGTEVAVWRVKTRTSDEPRWWDEGESANWTLGCRRWKRVEAE